MSKTIAHEFYCVKCGSRGIPLMRKAGHQHGKFHRKKIFCLKCQQEINHIECKSYEDVEWFKTEFEKGTFKEEAEQSAQACGGK